MEMQGEKEEVNDGNESDNSYYTMPKVYQEGSPEQVLEDIEVEEVIKGRRSSPPK
jgi:hypothetical protein